MSFRQEREAEHELYSSKKLGKVPANIIRKVTIVLDDDGDFLIGFQNGERLYALFVVLSDANDLGWKECHALRTAMEIAERGTQIDNAIFFSCIAKMKEMYGRVDQPSVHHGRLTSIVYPPKGEFRRNTDSTIVNLALNFDSDGDLVFTATSKDQHVYTVCLETYPRGASLTKLDCDAFKQVLQFLEPGDEVTPFKFFAFGLLLLEKYHFVTPSRSNNARNLSLTILPTQADSGRDPHPIFIETLQQLRTELANAPDSSSSGLVCPYPGISYTKALKEGGQAKVYAAKKGNQKVAVKVFLTNEGDEEATASYKTELRMLLKMSPHPNVVEVLDFFERPSPALLMRLVEGEDLSDYLQTHGKCSEEEGLKLVIGIAKGLGHLHQHGIVHRDLKTLNILRQQDGTAIIIDLGLGSDLKKSSSDTNMTMEQLCATMAATQITQQTSAMKGTIPWMPPEMITDQKWSEKTDVYAFGIIMWEIFSGKKPFAGKQGLAMLLAIAAGNRPEISAVSHISSNLRSLIQACWDQDPKRRPTMKRVMDLLQGNDPRQIFKAIDSDDNGTLDFGEFVTFLQRYMPGGVDPSVMYPLFQAIDSDNSGAISVDEFEEFWVQVEKGGLKFAMASGKRFAS